MELHDLSPVLAAQGPFVTVHVPADSAVELAADRYALAWRSVEKRLEELGVPAPVREALLASQGEHAEGASRLVVASVPEARVLLAAPVSTPPPTAVVEVSALPDLLPLVTDVTASVPHVVVLADRTGADVSAWYDTGRVAGEVTVKGRTLHLTKVHAGGWAHLQYQHRAENQWRDNAKEVSQTAAQLAEQVGAVLVVGVGDDRELAYVRDGLPSPWDERWVALPGGRGGDGSEALVQQRVRDAVALQAARETLELLADYARERGQDARARDGLPAVVEALRQAQVQTLLLTTDADRHSTLWFGEEASQLGTTRADVEALGATRPQEGPMLAVLLRAALATGADVQLVPHQSEQAPQSGLGALLRYTGS